MRVTARVTFEGHDSIVDCEPSETLLRAGLSAGLRLPYECASGGCGSCRAQLLDGTVHTLWEDAVGLSERDRRRGNRILMCQSVPDRDCVVKVPVVSSIVAEPSPERFDGRLASRTALTPDTALFTVELGRPMSFLPGQFALFESSSGIRRAYSMAHPERVGSTSLEFVIRAKPGGAASKWLFEEITLGEPLVLEGPYGRAYAQPDSTRPVLCVAGGTGLAPILAIAEHLLTAEQPPTLHVYVGARADADLVLLERLLRLRDLGAVMTLSAESSSGAVAYACELMPVREGRVIDHVASDWTQLADHDIYLSGPAGMVDAALRAFVRDGDAPADRLFYDRFFA